jgi:hypothetical protein
MAVTLSYGYINPENGDKGSVYYPALNSNITRLNGHDHDGVDSALLNAANIQKGTVTISSGSWTSNGTGSYKQDVTVPSGFNMSDYSITVYLSTGHPIYPTIEKLTATTFRIYTIDNTLTYTAVFR